MNPSYIKRHPRPRIYSVHFFALLLVSASVIFGQTNSSSIAKEFIYSGGRVIAVENSNYTNSPGLPNPSAPAVTIETPAANASVDATNVTFTGYVLDYNAAVDQVSATIDGQTILLSTTSRADICSSHPNAQGCPNIGWSATVNASIYAQGTSHTLVVTASQATLQGRAQVTFTVVKPLLAVDVPDASTPTFLGMVSFSGWAIDDAVGIANVTLVFDDNGQPLNATYGGSRADACGSASRPGCPNVGWSYGVNTAAMANGSHHVTVTATSNANVTTAVTRYFNVNNQPYPIGAPKGGGTLTASPNPMQPTSNGYGQTTLVYTSSLNSNEVHIGSPDGPLLTYGEAGTGYGPTGAWVYNGETFFLQDVTNNNPLTINNTLAMFAAKVQPNGVVLWSDDSPLIIQDGTGLGTITLSYSAPGVTNTTVTVGPNYQKFCGGGSSGTCQPTGKWVTNGTQFFLHNTPNGSTPTAANVIASYTATVIDLRAPQFVLTSVPRVVTVGGTYYPVLQVQAANGFSGAVALSAAGAPGGSSLTFAGNNLTPSAQTTMTVSSPLSTPWSYILIQGQSGSMQHNDTLELQNLPPQITGYSVGPYAGGNATVTVNATDAESDLSYMQINIAGADNQGTCAAAVSFTGGPSVLPGANANGACSVVSTAAASGNGASGTFTITFHFDSTRFYGSKSISAFAVEQSGTNTSSPVGGINIPQNQ